MVIAMLFIGAGMAASVSERHEWLLNLHKPLGIAILLLVVVRLFVRFSARQPEVTGGSAGGPGDSGQDVSPVAVRVDVLLIVTGR